MGVRNKLNSNSYQQVKKDEDQENIKNLISNSNESDEIENIIQ